MKVKSLSRVRLLATLWTAAYTNSSPPTFLTLTLQETLCYQPGTHGDIYSGYNQGLNTLRGIDVEINSGSGEY